MESGVALRLPPHSKISMQQQQRFILALVASAAVLILWSYFFPGVKQPPTNANANSQQTTASPQASAQPTASATPTPSQLAQSPSPTPDNIPQRKVRIVTPLYEATFDERWFTAAHDLADVMLAHFADPEGGFFDTADDHEQLVTRPKDVQDNAVPSGNSMAASGATPGMAASISTSLVVAPR